MTIRQVLNGYPIATVNVWPGEPLYPCRDASLDYLLLDSLCR